MVATKLGFQDYSEAGSAEASRPAYVFPAKLGSMATNLMVAYLPTTSTVYSCGAAVYGHSDLCWRHRMGSETFEPVWIALLVHFLCHLTLL